VTAAFPLCGVLVNATATLMAKITSKGNAVTAMSVHGAPCVGIGCLASSGIEAPHVSQNLLPELSAVAAPTGYVPVSAHLLLLLCNPPKHRPGIGSSSPKSPCR
jgi:hypothetical protein